jgi:hypothetical protein
MFAVPALYMQAYYGERSSRDSPQRRYSAKEEGASTHKGVGGGGEGRKSSKTRQTKDTREINAEMARMGKIDQRLFTILPIRAILIDSISKEASIMKC